MRQCEALRGWECGKKPLEALIDQSLTPSVPFLWPITHADAKEMNAHNLRFVNRFWGTLPIEPPEGSFDWVHPGVRGGG